jgi:hypothetical protein
MTQANSEFMMQFTQQTVTLMGITFVLGSLSTIFVLLILDMIRRSKEHQLLDDAAEADAGE